MHVHVYKPLLLDTLRPLQWLQLHLPPLYAPAELLVRQRKGLLERDALILAVDDPRPSLGSGSATLNALLCVSELLASQEGHKVR